MSDRPEFGFDYILLLFILYFILSVKRIKYILFNLRELRGFIVQACEQALDNDAAQWPEIFFDSGLSKEQLELLREGVAEMEEAIINMRRNRQKKIDCFQ